ncbi:enoyl-CoA hydratase-related protein [Thalassomonas haliotis]|uniref:Enoyl-CoA hydratase/isomerase family protein n=1 Tax=Thalassomonas haliotis TaxID=485448 RepID=A0ABY7V917_9GAMM|nr:enoyl-CoA hydratase-related protein [Thalassomonas haliotis]WDE09402.1 enoyl-CoA hydratase/isomerase family protein [Thalassomonas haliotis]
MTNTNVENSENIKEQTLDANANVRVEITGKVALVTLNRDLALNALSSALMQELIAKMQQLEARRDIGCFVITGNRRVFCAGADIKEMHSKSCQQMISEDYFSPWEQFSAIKTPKIAAVCGYALGGGCELAMMCDLIYAGESAVFAQPEINLGVIPGIGGTQRLTRSIGKAKAMDLILTGRHMAAREAEQAGLVARVFADESLLEEALFAAQSISEKGRLSVRFAKEAIVQSMELPLSQGLLFERRVFHSLFAGEEQLEGMAAFIEKRRPDFA